MIDEVPHHWRGVRQEELAVAVQDPEAPGRQHEESGAGEEDPHQADGQFALGALEARRDEVDEERRRQDAKEHQHADHERKQSADGARHLPRFHLVARTQQAGVDRDERRRERALAEQVLQQVRNAERRGEGVRGIADAEVVTEHPHPHQPDDAAGQDAQRHHQR